MLVLGGDRIKGVARFDLHANANANDSWIELILSSGFRVGSCSAERTPDSKDDGVGRGASSESI
jgi:hypothetical protein